MKKFYQEYLDTRSHPGEDILEWFIQKKMTWGMRMVLIHVLLVSFYFYMGNPMNLIYTFWGMLALGVFYLIGSIYHFIKGFIAKNNLAD